MVIFNWKLTKFWFKIESNVNSSITNILFCYRLTTMVSIIIFSLSWKFGVFIVTSSLCLMVFIIPSLATWYNEVKSCNHNLADRSFLFIPVPSFHQNDFLDNNFIEHCQKSRMKNKVIVCILIVLVVTLQYLITKEVIPFIPPDLW